MEPNPSAAWIQILLFIALLVIACLFLWTQQRTLLSIRPENRRMLPWQVWLQMIPLFGLGWQFFVITRIADSIRDELNTPIGDSIFSEDPIPTDKRPTYPQGISFAVLFCLTLLPLGLLKSLFSLAGLIIWIVYWVELSRYAKRVRQRAY